MNRLDETRPFIPLRIAILTMSDTRTAAEDKSGDTLAAFAPAPADAGTLAATAGATNVTFLAAKPPAGFGTACCAGAAFVAAACFAAGPGAAVFLAEAFLAGTFLAGTCLTAGCLAAAFFAGTFLAAGLPATFAAGAAFADVACLAGPCPS